MATTQTTSGPAVGALDQEPSAAPRRRRDDRVLVRVRRGLGVLALALLAGLIGYAVGRLQMTARVDRAWADHAEQLAAEAREQRAIEERAVELSREVRLLEGARHLARAERALEARNFGIAEASLRDAERTMRELGDAVPGAAALTARMASMRVTVASDVEEQRAALRALADRLDGVIEERAAHARNAREETRR